MNPVSSTNWEEVGVKYPEYKQMETAAHAFAKLAASGVKRLGGTATEEDLLHETLLLIRTAFLNTAGGVPYTFEGSKTLPVQVEVVRTVGGTLDFAIQYVPLEVRSDGPQPCHAVLD